MSLSKRLNQEEPQEEPLGLAPFLIVQGADRTRHLVFQGFVKDGQIDKDSILVLVEFFNGEEITEKLAIPILCLQNMGKHLIEIFGERSGGYSYEIQPDGKLTSLPPLNKKKELSRWQKIKRLFGP